MAALLLVWALPALADDDNSEGNAERERWELTLGLDGVYETKTEGADVYQFVPKFYIDLVYNNRFFASSDNGIGVYLARSDMREIGLSLTRGDDRQEDDDPLLLTGLPEIKKGLAPTLFFTQEIDDVIEIDAEFTYDFGGAKGALIDLSIGHDLETSETLSLELSTGISWAEGRILNTLYGVTSQQSSQRQTERFTWPDLIPLPETKISSGFYEITTDASFIYDFKDRWSGGIGGTYTKFLGGVKHSPLTRKNSEIEGIIFIRREF